MKKHFPLKAMTFLSIVSLSSTTLAAPIHFSTLLMDSAMTLYELQEFGKEIKQHLAEKEQKSKFKTFDELLLEQFKKVDKSFTPTMSEVDENIKQSIENNNHYINAQLSMYSHNSEKKWLLLKRKHHKAQTDNLNQFANLHQSIDKTQNINNTRFTKLDKKIDKTAKQAHSGIASVAAMSNIPYTMNTRFSAGVGLGHYHDGHAIAAGAQYQVKENINLRSSISWNNSDRAVVGAGIAIGW
ncbi:YadA-like family protein [Providencia vermicola]|uniref:YadA C-terminal domain-containing protein n=1 Tax=Providencia vermicola TaxID=333965 RepID=A0AAX3RWB1_9GAMM|nr:MULTISPECIES: YadA-like family protein [Providencia]ELX8378909.1 YadA-like family protein [Providencia stuartii]EMD5258114.1 YadA-like family protein [Providencia stuartii]USB36592.1 YadA-like family protein [Providencia vermicola]WFC05523.1 YadA C-terminal domain-containing protein [Providencia vermicola]